MTYETFPLTPDFEAGEEYTCSVKRVYYESGDVAVRANWKKARRTWFLQWGAATPTEAETLRAFLFAHKGACDAFYYTPMDAVPRPYLPPSTANATGGALGSRTVYVRHTWSDGTNETTPSYTAKSIALTNGFLVAATVPAFPSGVTQAYIYCGPDPANFYKQATPVTTSGGTWTEPETGYVTDLGTPPTTNALTETALVHFKEDSVQIAKMHVSHYAISLELEELFA